MIGSCLDIKAYVMAHEKTRVPPSSRASSSLQGTRVVTFLRRRSSPAETAQNARSTTSTVRRRRGAREALVRAVASRGSSRDLRDVSRTPLRGGTTASPPRRRSRSSPSSPRRGTAFRRGAGGGRLRAHAARPRPARQAHVDYGAWSRGRLDGSRDTRSSAHRTYALPKLRDDVTLPSLAARVSKNAIRRPTGCAQPT